MTEGADDMAKSVKYIGPYAEGVDVQVDGRWLRCLPGASIEVPDAVAASLCEQTTNWEPVKAAPPPKDSGK